MLSWLWRGGAGPAPPPVSPALREAQDLLSAEIVARLRDRCPLIVDDRALAAACGFDDARAPALSRCLAAAVRSYGDEPREQPTRESPSISNAAVLVAAAHASARRAEWALAVLQGGGTASGDAGPVAVALEQLEAVVRDCLRLVDDAKKEADNDDDDDDDAASVARAAARGAAQTGTLGGSEPPSPSSSSSSPPSHVSRAALATWIKQGPGVALADFLSSLLQRLALPDDAAPTPLWPYPPPRLLLPRPSAPHPPPLLLSPRAALLLAPHVPDPRRRARWRLVFSAALHGKSWSSLLGRLAAAGASAAANVEAHADAAAASAFAAAAGGAGTSGGGHLRGGDRAARAAAAAAAAASAPRSAADADDDRSGGDEADAAARWSGPPATLVLARDAATGAVFGGAAASPWRRRPHFYGGGAGAGGGPSSSSSSSSCSAFLLALSPDLRVHPASGINDHVQYLGTGFQSLPNGLGMGGQVGAFGFWLDAGMERGHSRPNSTFACAPLCSGAAQDFNVSDVEVWAMLTPEEDEGPGGAAVGARGGRSVLDAEDDRNFLAVAGRFADHSAGVRD
jgi:hypothetical protein